MADKVYAPHYERGTYKVKMTGSYGFGKSAKKNTPFFEGSFKVMAKVDPVTKAETPCEKNYERKFTVYLTKDTEKFAIDQLKAIGWDGTALSRLDRTKPGYQDIEGCEFLAYCKYDAHFKDPKASMEVWGISTGEAPSSGKGVKVACEEGIAEDLDSLFGFQSVRTSPVSSEPVDMDSLPF